MFNNSISACGAVLLLLFALGLSHVERRSPPFIRGSAIGYLVAVAIPLELAQKNVFLAFNFEANYGLPYNQTHRDLIEKWNLDGHREGVKNNFTSINLRSTRNVYSRKYIYNSFENLLRNFGYKGKVCLLRIICELSASPLSDFNGILGTLAHIILLPSTSMAERISGAYYKAEELGRRGNCTQYFLRCPNSLLDIITTVDHL